MKKKILTITFAVFFLITAFFILRFILGGNEDIWICRDGQWVKHGNPNSPMPSSGCEQENQQTPSYLNQELGFSLEIPASWEGKYEVNVLSLDPRADSETGSITSASFDFIPQEGNNHMLFSINKVSSSDWEKLQKEELFRGRKLAETNEAVYYAEYSLDNPFFGINGDTYQEMAADTSPILATFSLN